MSDTVSSGHNTRARTVQDWIDERPQWPDGTSLPSVPMTRMQWLIWSLAAAGKFFEGFVVFMTGVALPLFSEEYHLGSAEHGFISAASLFGILIGAVTLGGMSDRFGRKAMFIVEMIIFVRLPRRPRLRTEFLSHRALPVRDRPGARLRLSDGAHDHLRVDPEPSAAASSCSVPSPSRPSARWPAPPSATACCRRYPSCPPGAGCTRSP